MPHKPAIGKFTSKILAEREQVPLFPPSESCTNNASAGVIVNPAYAPRPEAQIDHAPYGAARNGSPFRNRTSGSIGTEMSRDLIDK
jgi:hypothetical protein